MLKGHPKGLLVAFFANMGERFGFYTMMGILVLFLQARFGLDGKTAGIIYSVFYAAIYALALVGGIVADRFAGMKKTITLGIVMMALGYFILALPVVGIQMGLIPVCFGLFVIAFGNGMFKGNLQAVVGNLYEKKEYSHLRDSAFSIFYMGINIGALFAPTVAVKLRDWYLNSQGLGYDASLPSVCHTYMNGGEGVAENLQVLAGKASLNGVVGDLGAFASKYVEAFSTGYNYAFGFAAIMMLLSLVIYFVFNKHLAPGFAVPAAVTADGKVVAEMPAKEVKERIVALCLVFAVVIFFWMSFHQNGLTLTFYARDFVASSVPPSTAFWFYLSVLLPIFGAAVGGYMLIKKGATSKDRVIGIILAAVFGALAYYQYTSLPLDNSISAELFQHLNPFFIVALTPIVVGIFSWLNKKGLEPTAPRKIAYGMILAAVGFVVVLVSSLGLSSPAELDGVPSPDRISPYWLIGTYFILTIAELFLSPMGISFVSKVAPPKFKGMMQGLWLCATAIGNQLLFIGAIFYESTALWITWAFFVLCCLISAAVMFGLLKRIERVAK